MCQHIPLLPGPLPWPLALEFGTSLWRPRRRRRQHPAATMTGRCPRFGPRHRGMQESGGHTPGCFANRARGLSLSAGRTAALLPGSRRGGAATGAVSVPLADSALGARRGWGWLCCAGGCWQRDPGAGQCRGAGSLQWLSSAGAPRGRGTVRQGAQGCGARQGAARDSQQPLLCIQVCFPPCSSLRCKMKKKK